jgi:arabinofuranan 3-O-arabinosyltransferase
MAAGEPVRYVIPPRLWSWLGSQRTVSILLWLAALGTGGYLLDRAIHWFDDPPDTPPERRRGDGNNGHMQIDFGGQWLMARTLVTGHGRELYHRQRHWEIAREGFAVESEMPLVQEESLRPTVARIRGKRDEILKHDADRLMGWCMGEDSSEWKTVGGAAATTITAPSTCAARYAACGFAIAPSGA